MIQQVSIVYQPGQGLRGHILERETTPGSAKGSKRKLAEVEYLGDSCETEGWWPTRIDLISSEE